MKTLVAAQPILAQTHNSTKRREVVSNCFEILGFDVMLDRKYKPWLIEVNHSPSFSTDAPIDQEVKSAVIGHALFLLNVSRFDRKRQKKNDSKDAKDRLFKPPNRGLDALQHNLRFLGVGLEEGNLPHTKIGSQSRPRTPSTIETTNGKADKRYSKTLRDIEKLEVQRRTLCVSINL